MAVTDLQVNNPTSSQQSQPKRNLLNTIGAKFDQWLIQSFVPLSDAERRDARLVTWLSFAVLISTTIRLLLRPNFPIILSVVILGMSYILSRTQLRKVGAFLLVLSLAMPAFAGIFEHETITSGNDILLRVLWLALPLVLSSVFFSWRTMALFALMCFVGVTSLPLFRPDITFAFLSGSLGFVGTVSVLLMLVVNHRNKLELDRQAELRTANEQLRQSEAQLEQRVIERTQQLEAARQEAEQANQVKSMFLASTSHELRTPLNAVINLSKFVLDGSFGEVNDQQQEMLGNVHTSAKHLLSLINDILDISKIESGSLQLFVEDNIDLAEELGSIQSTAMTLLDGKPVNVKAEIEALPLISGDRLRIRQIVLNLVSNACKFTDSGEIVISAVRQGDGIVIRVRDTGPGIPAEDQETIFETFRQTALGIRKGKGTGLGLPISRRLAEAHGGRLWVESTPGQGATFSVALPINPADQKEIVRL